MDDTSVVILLEQLGHISKYHAMKRMEALDLKPGQAGILFILNAEGSMSQKRLAGKIGITPPSMTAALKKLENRGYIKREADHYDQRVFRVALTEKGKEYIAELQCIMDEMDELLFQGISYEEKLFVKRLLLEMRKNLMKQKEFEGMDLCMVMEKTKPPMPREREF